MRVASVSVRATLTPRRLVAILVVLTLAGFCPACSSGRKPAQPVRGRVLVDGQPAAHAQVLFHPAESPTEELRPSGQTDEQGYFNLTSYVNSDGAPEGSYAVTVSWFRVFRAGAQPNADIVRHNVLPYRYATPQTSQLRVTVNKGSNELTPLQLYSR